MGGTLDIFLETVDADPNFTEQRALKLVNYTYDVQKDIKNYDLKLFKALSQALGGTVLPNLITDFGGMTEKVILNGVIEGEGPPLAGETDKDGLEKKMIEMAYFIRIKCFNADSCYFRSGVYFGYDSWVTPIGIGGSRELVDSPTYGIEGKPEGITFKYVFEENLITYKITFVFGMDIEVV